MVSGISNGIVVFLFRRFWFTSDNVSIILLNLRIELIIEIQSNSKLNALTPAL